MSDREGCLGEALAEIVLTVIFAGVGALIFKMFGIELDSETIDGDLLVLAGIGALAALIVVFALIRFAVSKLKKRWAVKDMATEKEKQTVRFVIIRHGYSQFNRSHRFSGQYDVPLDEIGIRQARSTAEYVLKNYKIDAIYSSDLSRAYETARPVAEALDMPIITSRALRELDVGKWECKTAEEIMAEYPESLSRYKENCGSARCDGGESYVELWERSVAEMDRIAAENMGKTVLVATHGGVIRCLRCAWRGIPPEELYKLPHVPNASVTVAESEGGVVRLLQEGYCGHLEDKTTELAIN